eukprot:gene361-biopygen375
MQLHVSSLYSTTRSAGLRSESFVKERLNGMPSRTRATGAPRTTGSVYGTAGARVTVARNVDVFRHTTYAPAGSSFASSHASSAAMYAVPNSSQPSVPVSLSGHRGAASLHPPLQANSPTPDPTSAPATRTRNSCCSRAPGGASAESAAGRGPTASSYPTPTCSMAAYE